MLAILLFYFSLMEVKIYKWVDVTNTLPLARKPGFLLRTLSSLDLCPLLFNNNKSAAHITSVSRLMIILAVFSSRGKPRTFYSFFRVPEITGYILTGFACNSYKRKAYSGLKSACFKRSCCNWHCIVTTRWQSLRASWLSRRPGQTALAVDLVLV